MDHLRNIEKKKRNDFDFELWVENLDCIKEKSSFFFLIEENDNVVKEKTVALRE